ncbi:hypothetical protein ACRQ5Q_39470 [Bradyrhizobium sp. PMVTL-01]|uniref:hypothetical protein n=1 Tax=Bradyrhizobium sp. PMVTL-01 TaxID=3434999 RepID=UPI003F6E71DD
MPKIIIRVPPDVKAWIAAQTSENASSQSSEIVRALRERMARCGSTVEPLREEKQNGA